MPSGSGSTMNSFSQSNTPYGESLACTITLDTLFGPFKENVFKWYFKQNSKLELKISCLHLMSDSVTDIYCTSALILWTMILIFGSDIFIL